MNQKEVESILNALIASTKGGILLDDLNTEFYRQTFMDIPYLSLGYSSLYEFMRNLKHITTQRNQQGNVVYVLRNNKNINHIVEMVQRQKGPSSRMNKRIYQRKSIMKKTTTNRRTKFRNYRMNIGNSENENSNESYDSYEEEIQRPIVINSPPKNVNQIHTPICNGKQLIGDDFFLQLAIRNLKLPIWRKQPCSPLQCGLCVSGLTVRNAIKKLQSIESLSNKVIIMLGAEDIYKGRSAEDIIEDFENLLNILHTRFAFSTNAITICTIPPLANIGIYNYAETMMNIRALNNTLCNISAERKYGFIDFFTNYTSPNLEVAYDLFQMDARMVSGSSRPYVLFNKRGRRLAINLLRGFNVLQY